MDDGEITAQVDPGIKAHSPAHTQEEHHVLKPWWSTPRHHCPRLKAMVPRCGRVVAPGAEGTLCVIVHTKTPPPVLPSISGPRGPVAAMKALATPLRGKLASHLAPATLLHHSRLRDGLQSLIRSWPIFKDTVTHVCTPKPSIHQLRVARSSAPWGRLCQY